MINIVIGLNKLPCSTQKNVWFDFKSYKLVVHEASSVRVQRQRMKIDVLCSFSGGIKKEWLPLLYTFLQWHELLWGPAPFC